jgi:hypothetical protein
MAELKPESSPVAVIGDVVDSRSYRDRQALHDDLDAVLHGVNADVPASDPLVITVGDEFQGVYPTLGDALRAAFLVRSRLHPRADVRFGLGRGAVSTLDAARGIHDGPAYWAARDAIVDVEDRSRHPQSRASRTAYAPSDAVAPATAAHDTALRAALDCLDHVVGSMSSTSREILGGLMDGLTQHDVAERLGVSDSAVSQRVRRDGVGVALDVMERLGTLP